MAWASTLNRSGFEIGLQIRYPTRYEREIQVEGPDSQTRSSKDLGSEKLLKRGGLVR